MKRIIPLIMLAVFVVVVLFTSLPASPAYAFDPPWPAGLPWPTTVPWPTANPLTIGVPWSPSAQSFPVYVTTPVPPAVTLPVPRPLPIPPVIVSGGAPQPAIPPVVVSAGVPQPAIPPSSNSVAPSIAPPMLDSGGSTKASAYVAGDNWRSLSAGASAWYRIGTSGEHMDVWLDASPHTGVSMAIFAPDGGDRPIGQGSPFNADPTRLFWSGGHWSGDGFWYARISNDSPVSVLYRVTSSQQDISNRSCFSYWEHIRTALVYWTECNR